MKKSISEFLFSSNIFFASAFSLKSGCKDIDLLFTFQIFLSLFSLKIVFTSTHQQTTCNKALNISV